MNNTIEYKDVEATIYSIKGWLNCIEPIKVLNTLSKLLYQAEFNVLDKDIFKFPIQGFTAYWVLSESHLAVHSFDNQGKCYFELSSCNKEKTECFANLVQSCGFEVELASASVQEIKPTK